MTTNMHNTACCSAFLRRFTCKFHIALPLLFLLFASCEKNIFVDRNNDPVDVFDAFWHEIDRNYSFFTYTHLNWDSIYTVYRPRVSSATDDRELFQIFGQMLDLLHDAHTNLYSPFGVIGNIHYFESFPINELSLSESYFETYSTINRVLDIGMLKQANIAYLKIKTFDGDPTFFDALDSILPLFGATKALIIDVRSNRGGLVSNSQSVAGRFADSSRLVGRYRTRNGPNHQDFSAWIDFKLMPKTNSIPYPKPLVLLTNRSSYSATEWFIEQMHTLPQVTCIGDTTGGGSAIPLARELPNSWMLRISNTQTQQLSGGDYQFKGIPPDLPVWINAEDEAKGRDTILERAIAFLNSF